jgi:hypothetical protein
VLRSLKKGLSVNDLGNYFPGSIREAVSARADKGVAARQKRVEFIDARRR